MKLTSSSFSNNGAIPAEFAFCSIDPVNKITMSKNRNPQLAWSGAPAGTKSFALVCHDYDVPSVADDVNKEGKSIPASLPRVDFFHWTLVDLPPTVTSMPPWCRPPSGSSTRRSWPGCGTAPARRWPLVPPERCTSCAAPSTVAGGCRRCPDSRRSTLPARRSSPRPTVTRCRCSPPSTPNRGSTTLRVGRCS